jgi:quercetin dioxygenase-like cupin family protein
MQLGLLASGQGKAYWVLGDLYTILSSGDDTGGAFALIHAIVPPDGGPPPHVHRREDEAFYVLDGDLSFHADGTPLSATKGCWITLPKNSLHFFRNTGPNPATMLILVSPSGLEKFFAEVGQEVKDRSAPPPPVTPADVQRLLDVAPRYGIEIHVPK